MQESKITSTDKEKHAESKMASADTDKDADIRQPSINTEPRTLNETKMERVMVAAQEIYAEHPEPTSDCFIKDAADTATRENPPAKGGADANELGTHLDKLVQRAGNVVDTNFTQSKAPLPTETPAAPPPTPSS